MRNNKDQLTVVVPTHNRPRHCAAQLRFFKACGLRHNVVVADSSNPAEAETVRGACAGIADYQSYDPRARDKFLVAVRSVKTPFVVMAPDDDVVFPHAIDAALDYLVQRPDYVVAHGYTLRFGLHGNDVDIHSVYSFVPSIDNDDPFERHYDLMRRYQPFFWALFRRDVLVSLLEATQLATGPLFQELMFMNAGVFQGKVAMLPMIYAMRGMEESQTPVIASHPFFSFLRNAESFFSTYVSYRNALAKYVRERTIAAGTRRFKDPLSGEMNSSLEQFIDLVHATWLGREVNVGTFNHAAQLLLGKPISLIQNNPVWPGQRDIGEGDVVHAGRGGRRYVWRRTVLEAEPRNEITIGADELVRVEQQLEGYHLA